jgi:hypothetical protein
LGERALDCRWRLRLAKEQRGRALGTGAFLLEPSLNGRADWATERSSGADLQLTIGFD